MFKMIYNFTMFGGMNFELCCLQICSESEWREGSVQIVDVGWYSRFFRTTFVSCFDHNLTPICQILVK